MVQCVSTCQERQCEQNKVVTKGVSAPLEVFYTGEPSCDILSFDQPMLVLIAHTNG